MMMKKLLLLLALLFAGPAFAVDNTVLLTPCGTSCVTLRSKDVGAGVESLMHILGDTGGNPIYGTAGVANANILTVQGIAAMTPFLTSLNQLNGVAVLTGNGVTGTGSQRVTISSDNTAFSVNAAATLAAETTKVIGTVRSVGNVGGVFDAIGQNVAAPANWMQIGCQFQTTPTTIVAGNGSPFQCDNAANALVNVKVSALPAGAATAANQGLLTTWAGGTLGAMANYGTSPGAVLVPGVNAFVTNSNANGRAVSGNSSPVVPTPALSTWHLIAAASTNATSVKGSAATVFSCQLANNSANIGYLKIYNKATAPTVGTDVPVKTLIIPGPSAGGGGSNISFGPGGLTLSAGFAAAVTGVITDADTTAVAATAFALNCDYE